MSQNEAVHQPTWFTGRLVLVPLADEHPDFEVGLDAGPEVMRYLAGRGLDRGEGEQGRRRRRQSGRPAPVS